MHIARYGIIGKDELCFGFSQALVVNHSYVDKKLLFQQHFLYKKPRSGPFRCKPLRIFVLWICWLQCEPRLFTGSGRLALMFAILEVNSYRGLRMEPNADVWETLMSLSRYLLGGRLVQQTRILSRRAREHHIGVCLCF